MTAEQITAPTPSTDAASGTPPPAAHTVITVTDSGHGITPEQQQRLFTPFYSTKQHGTGLGLAVSWGIVRNHGGSIEVHSVPGQGSGFAVRLPLVD